MSVDVSKCSYKGALLMSVQMLQSPPPRLTNNSFGSLLTLPICWVWKGISLWFQFVFPWKLMRLKFFSFVYRPSVFFCEVRVQFCPFLYQVVCLFHSDLYIFLTYSGYESIFSSMCWISFLSQKLVFSCSVAGLFINKSSKFYWSQIYFFYGLGSCFFLRKSVPALRSPRSVSTLSSTCFTVLSCTLKSLTSLEQLSEYGVKWEV